MQSAFLRGGNARVAVVKIGTHHTLVSYSANFRSTAIAKSLMHDPSSAVLRGNRRVERTKIAREVDGEEMVVVAVFCSEPRVGYAFIAEIVVWANFALETKAN